MINLCPSLIFPKRIQMQFQTYNLSPRSVRLVFAPPTLVKNVVEEYCQPTSKTVFSVDTTYNIGPFYVTPTAYWKGSVISNVTNNSAVFPDLPMSHEKKTSTAFFALPVISQN